MLTRRMRLQVLAFVVIALCVTSYLSARYVGVDLFRSDYRVTLSLPQGGGAFTNGEVTFRGVPVGRIESLRTTSDGAEAVLRIDSDAPAIPADVEVEVANRSAIGEQYVNLTGDVSHTPKLADGDHLEADTAGMPPATDELLRSADRFLDSVPRDALTTVIDETYELARDANRYLPRLLQTSEEFADTADKNFLVTKGLIENAGTVLETQHASAASLRSFSRDLRLLARTIRTSDGPLRALIKHTPTAAVQVDQLFTEVGLPLGTLMANLVSTAQVLGVNADGIEDALIRLPEAVSVGFALNGAAGLNLGLVQSYFDPLPCVQGYAGTPVREGLATGAGEPFNKAAGCTMDPGSGTNVRGPRAAPPPADLTR